MLSNGSRWIAAMPCGAAQRGTDLCGTASSGIVQHGSRRNNVAYGKARYALHRGMVQRRIVQRHTAYRGIAQQCAIYMDLAHACGEGDRS